MGHDRKYGDVTTEHGSIPGAEPVLILRAQDALTPETLTHYLNLATAAGSPERHLTLIRASIDAFREWQTRNPGKTRIPHSEHSREWLPE